MFWDFERCIAQFTIIVQMKDVDEALVNRYLEGVLVLRNAVEAMYDSWADIVFGRQEDYDVIFENVKSKNGFITGHRMQRGSVQYTLDIEKDVCYVKDSSNSVFSMSVDARNKITIREKKENKKRKQDAGS